MSSLGWFHAELSGGIRETGGSTVKTVVPSRTTNAIPTTNSGSAASARVKTDSEWSSGPSRRRADAAPMRIASGTPIRAAISMRNAEFSMRGPRSSVTGCRATSDSPRSPLRTPENQSQYCSTTGRLRFSCSRRAARDSGVAVRPRTARAGSPGSAWVAAKMMTEATKSVTTPSSVRRTMKPVRPRRTRGRRRPVGSAVPVSVRNPAVNGSLLTAASAEVGGAMPGPPSTGPIASAWRALDKEDRPEPIPVLVQIESALVGLQAAHGRAVGIDEVLEAPDDVAALVILELLHLANELAAEGLVEGGVGQAPHGHLGEVVPSSPEVGGKRPLEVLVAVEDGAVHVLHVDRDPGILRVLGEDLRAFDHPGVGRRRVAVDGQTVLPSRAQQRPRLLDVLLPLRELVPGVAGVERSVDVVRNPAVACQALVDHLSPVGDQAKRLAHAHVLERVLVDAHRDRRPAAGLRLVDRKVVATLDQRDLPVRLVGHRVELTSQESVDLGRLRREVDDLHRVEVRLALPPVVLEADVLAPLARPERLDPEGARADRVALADRVGAVAVLHDALEVMRERVEERRVRPLEREPNSSLVHLLDPVGVDGSEAGLPEEPEVRVQRSPDRVDEIVRGEGLTVVELDPCPQADRPHVRGLGGDFLREAVGRGRVLLVEVREGFEGRGEEGGVGRF